LWPENFRLSPSQSEIAFALMSWNVKSKHSAGYLKAAASLALFHRLLNVLGDSLWPFLFAKICMLDREAIASACSTAARRRGDQALI